MSVVALDSGALIGLARDKRAAYAALKAYIQYGWAIVIPAPVLAEVLRGGPQDAEIHRVSKGYRVVETTAKAAARAGKLLGDARAPRSDTLDALILATAIEHGASEILTTDPADTLRLSGGTIEPISL